MPTVFAHESRPPYQLWERIQNLHLPAIHECSFCLRFYDFKRITFVCMLVTVVRLIKILMTSHTQPNTLCR